MRCVLCKKALPKRGQRGRKGAHVDCLRLDEVESILATGYWIHPISGQRKGEWPWRGTTTGRTSVAQPNMQNLSSGQARSLAKQINFAQAYGAGPRKIADMLKQKGLTATMDFSAVERRLVKELKLDTLLSSVPSTSEPDSSGSTEEP